MLHSSLAVFVASQEHEVRRERREAGKDTWYLQTSVLTGLGNLIAD